MANGLHGMGVMYVAAEGLKWRVNNAVKRSKLAPPSRLVMFVLSDRADAKTAVIPDGHTPSLSDLAKETGLGLATVKRHLDALELCGWVERLRPTEEERVRGVRTRYKLAIGKNPGTAHKEPRVTAHSEPSDHGSEGAEPGVTESPGTAQSELRHGSEEAQSTAQSEPSSYIDDRNDLDDQKTAADAAPPDAEQALFPEPKTAPAEGTKKPSKRGPADELTDAFWKVHGKNQAQSWVAVRAVIRIALNNQIERDDLARALDRVAREGRAISGGTLTNALSQLRSPSQQANGHTPWRNPTDSSVYHEAI